MSTDTARKSDETAPGESPAKRAPLSEEQRRWIGEVAAEIKKERNDVHPPRPADELSPRARAGAAAAAAGASPAWRPSAAR